jgi:signal peptide peptidase SppA
MKHRVAELQQSVWGVRAEVLPVLRAFAHGQIEADELRAHTETEKAAVGGMQAPSKVAVIPLTGMITPKGSLLGALFGIESGLQGFRSSLARAVADESITSILLNIDSPGGLVDLVPETAADIRSAREAKPVVAVANTMAASAAYWLAAQANELIVTPSGRVGSVGVVAMHEDISGLLEKEGVDLTFISAGKYKVEGNPYEALGEEARAAMQQRIDEVYGMFVADVAKGRGLSTESVRKDFGQGRMVSPKDAASAGMVDRIDTLEATAARLVRGRSRIKGTGATNLKLSDHLSTSVAEADEVTTRIEEAIAQRSERGQVLAEETRELIDELARSYEVNAERLREALAIEPRSENQTVADHGLVELELVRAALNARKVN